MLFANGNVNFRPGKPFSLSRPVILSALFMLFQNILSQSVYHHISNRAVYEFLDEMACEGHIELNTAVLPYSRAFIAERLAEVNKISEKLNDRQVKELDFYLRDFNKELRADNDFRKRFDLLHYRDSLFSITANIIMGYQYWTNSNGNVYHRWNGGEVHAYTGRHWGFYASLRDNHETEPFSDAQYLCQRMGGNYKAAYDYSEMRGGVTFSWDWGMIGLVKDHHIWGNNHHGSNIQSGRTPSFAKVQLQLKPVQWFEFSYFHGWLVSEVVDSTRSYRTSNISGSIYREVYHPKYMAANIFSFRPFKKFFISAGNSIIYADIGVHPAYLIPVFFFKSVDHTLNSGTDNQNSQMFLDISSRNIRRIHLYGTLFIDELAISRLMKADEHSNYWSWKLGTHLGNMPLKNLGLTLEYTRSNPRAFRHPTPQLQYSSNEYNLGHYLSDNSVEYYLAVSYKPLPKLGLSLSGTLARKGPDYRPGDGSLLGLPFMEKIEWESGEVVLSAIYQLINDAFLFARYRYSNITGEMNRYTFPLWHGKNNTYSFGLNFGF